MSAEPLLIPGLGELSVAGRPKPHFLEKLMSPIENSLDALGLYHPVSRLIAFSLASGGVIYLLKPNMFFEGDEPRPWSVISDSNGYIAPSPITWWMAAFGIGAVAGLLL